jgi:hypothetical protein
MSTKQDHLSIEEEAWAFDKEVHAKLDDIQEVSEDFSGTHSTRPAIS